MNFSSASCVWGCDVKDGVRSYAAGDLDRVFFLLLEFVCFETEGSWRLWSVINFPSSFCVRVWVIMMIPVAPPSA